MRLLAAKRSVTSGLLRLTVSALLLAPCLVTRADKVYLQSGSVLEGEVTREGDKVVVKLESGTIRLPAASVARIEAGETALARIARLRAELPKDAIEERLKLANECRAAELARCERELLEEVIARSPEHAEARLRLGHERGPNGWLTRKPNEQEEPPRRERDPRTEDERIAERARLAREAELSRARAELALAREQLALTRYPSYLPYLYDPNWGPSPASPTPLPALQIRPFVINGVRLPNESGFSLPGVRTPASYFD